MKHPRVGVVLSPLSNLKNPRWRLFLCWIGRHLGFLKMLKGERSTPTLGCFIRPYTTTIHKEKNFIKNSEVPPVGRQTSVYHNLFNNDQSILFLVSIIGYSFNHNMCQIVISTNWAKMYSFWNLSEIEGIVQDDGGGGRGGG